MFDLTSLKNILDELVPPPLVTSDDRAALLELAGELLDYYVKSDPLMFAEPSFHENVKNDVFEEMQLQVADVFKYDIDGEIEYVIDQASKLYFAHIVPRRSYFNSIVVKQPNIIKMRNKINYLRNIPQPDQRTPEWYEFRHMYLTASSIWKAFSTEGNQNQLIYSKCIPIDTSKYSRFNLDSALHWGVKYEDLSIIWYQNQYCTKVEDFGCIPHDSLSFLAASPDGINVDETSGRFGRMLEVKNIVNREITGIPKFEYWIQMQIQMEVCNLNECDFLETRFIEYNDADEFYQDGNFNTTNDGKDKGIMLQFMKDGMPIYKYPPWKCSEEEYRDWEQATMKETEIPGECYWLQNIYWRLDEVSVVLVVRNKLWFENATPVLENIWNIIVKERETGFEHRAPRKRIKSNAKKDDPKDKMKCLIDLSDMNMEIDINVPNPEPLVPENIVISIETEHNVKTNI